MTLWEGPRALGAETVPFIDVSEKEIPEVTTVPYEAVNAILPR